MPSDESDDLLRLGVNYDLERWTKDELDSEGHIIWHHGYPSPTDWDDITMVTINYEVEGEGHYRNIPIDPARPLDPYLSNHPDYTGPHKGGRYGPDFYYDLDNLATNFYWATGTP